MDGTRLSVAIADDERKVAQLIHDLIPWQELGLEPAGMVYNGQDLLELVASERPDIAILDIRMPKMDGLEVIEKAIGQSIGTRFVIISGYRYFEYAHNALQYGVKNYLLKPVNEAELRETLEKIIGEIGQERRQKNEEAVHYERLQQNEVFVKRDMIHRLLGGDPAMHSLQRVNREYSTQLGAPCYRGLVIKADCEDDREKGTVRAALMLEKCAKRMHEHLSPLAQALPMGVVGQRLYCLINYQGDDWEPIRQAVSEFFFTIQDYAGAFKGYALTLSLSGAAEAFDKAGQVLAEADEGLASRLLQGTGRILKPAGDGAALPREEYDLWFRHTLEKALLGAEPGQIEAAVRALREKLGSVGGVAPGEYGRLARQTLQRASAWCGPGQSAAEGLGPGQLWRLDNLTTLDGLFRYLADQLVGLAGAHAQKLQQMNTRPVRQARLYIKLHYAEKVTLDILAEEVGLSPVYLGNLFKKETGQTVGEYLTDVRMAAARELLRQTNLTVEAVSEKAGYRDTKHFSQLFSKTVGVKPAKYRKLYS